MLSNMPNTSPTSRCHCPKLLHGRTNNQGQLAEILKINVFIKFLMVMVMFSIKLLMAMVMFLFNFKLQQMLGQTSATR